MPGSSRERPIIQNGLICKLGFSYTSVTVKLSQHGLFYIHALIHILLIFHLHTILQK